MRRRLLITMLLTLFALPAAAQQLLVPMDDAQTEHLKAYGLTYWVLDHRLPGEWLLNYRSGSFLLPDRPEIRREAALRGVTVVAVDGAQIAQIHAQIAQGNMERVILEKAPKIAVYTPDQSYMNPWDDAVLIALNYADIPYDKLWDPEVLQGRLGEYDWLHLHHEDFTGQYSKFYLNNIGAAWLQQAVQMNEATAAQFQKSNVPDLKQSVAEEMRRYVAQGGFLFAMCTATETLELALAALGVDIASAFSDGTPPDPQATQKLQWQRTLAFRDAELQLNPGVNAFSDIDGHQVNTPWRQQLGTYSLFEFSAKFDPVPSMLVQNHERVLRDFYGLTTSFRRDRLKSGVVVLAEEEGASWVKYIHGTFGEGTWTFLGGHDPEDPEHQIGEAATDLSMYPHSPGYRLILNNVLFPAAKKKTLKT
ncbi:MAG TPA: hypothetical protein VMN60_14810 [Longimicrobiales bacterium]|nr:hypothetical protein [Longimicrobiales bacterium]